MITASDMTSAAAACRAAQPSEYPDFCYVRVHSGGTEASDSSQCSSDGGSWIGSTECCNYEGTLSCAPSCPSGTTSCSTGCADLDTDTQNCGSCGNVCPSGQVCTSGSCMPRHFVCGYATSGNNCDDFRTSIGITATDMNDAITQCQAMLPSGKDFCYTKNDVAADYPNDSSQCSSDGGSWRPTSSCCNFLGTLSCPS